MRLPIPFPAFRSGERIIDDGYLVQVTPFCREKELKNDSACAAHYELMCRSPASIFTMCPYGFSSYKVSVDSGDCVITGVVASPRFDNSKERDRAKTFPSSRVSRKAVEDLAISIARMSDEWQRIQEEARRRLPQALHELRKLNAIVKQSAEKLRFQHPNSADAENAVGAAKLMSNIFEIVEVLTNLEEVPVSVAQKLEFISVFDLAYKAKKIYQIRAKLRPIHIRVAGDEVVGILGSKRYFPLVLQVLLDNAIKYGVKDSTIEIAVSRNGGDCMLSVSNRIDNGFDKVACFEKGRRFADVDADGDGLGLYLAREVVAAHGGSISCDFLAGDAVFSVRIPAHSEPAGKRR